MTAHVPLNTHTHTHTHTHTSENASCGTNVLRFEDPVSFPGDTTNKMHFHGDFTFRQSLSLKNGETSLRRHKSGVCNVDQPL